MPLSSDEVATIVREVVAARERLGLVWRLIPGTVAGVESDVSVMVNLDGDEQQAPARALVLGGGVLKSGRVMVLWLPPQGFYCWAVGPGTLSGLEVSRTAGQNITTGGSPQSLSWDTVVWESGLFDITVPTTDVVLPRRGRYRATVNVGLAASAVGFRYAALYNGANAIASVQQAPPPAGSWLASIAREFTGNTGDILTVRVQQGSGGTLAATGTLTLNYVGSV